MLDLAIHNLTCLRGLNPRANDPVVRLHLLTSLYEQARTDLFETTLAAHQRGYSPTQIAVVLNLHETTTCPTQPLRATAPRPHSDSMRACQH